MSTWHVGRTYNYYGRELRCVGRYFDRLLEIVALQNADEPWDGQMPPYRADLLNVCGMIPGHPAFFRAARTLAPCVLPRVTETLGGVMNAAFCRHDLGKERLIADAGPNAGKLCCGLCGGEIGLDGL